MKKIFIIIILALIVVAVFNFENVITKIDTIGKIGRAHV